MSQNIFSQARLEEWKQVDSDNWQTIVAELIDLFLSTAENKFLELKAASNNGDSKSVSQLAHSLKSSCANVGAMKAYSMFQELEHSAKAQSSRGKLDSMVRELTGVFADSLGALKTYRNDLD